MPAVFYPGAKCRLQIGFENFLPTPPNPIEQPATPGPQGPEGFGQGTLSAAKAQRAAVIDVVPYTCSVEMNSYRKADEARATLPLRNLPFDPRIVRTATLQVFGGTFGAGEFADANGPVGAEGLVLPDVVPIGRGEAGESNEIFRGFVDDWDVSIEGRDTVTITARDATGRLLDAEIPENFLRDLPQNVPLDQLIQLLLTGDGIALQETSRRFGLAGFRGMVVVNETADQTADLVLDLPTLEDIRPPQWLDSKRTAKKGRKRAPGGGQNQSFWDVITDLCVSAGFIVYMRPGKKPVEIPGFGLSLPATEIVISNPRTYYKESGTTGLVVPPGIRVLTYGQNVGKLSIKRKLGGIKVPTVEVRAFDTATGDQLAARFPPSDKLPTKRKNNEPTTSGKGDREEVKVFNLDEISGPKALEQLESAARSIYEQLGRGEMEMRASTKHLAALPANRDKGIEADLFRLKPGDPIVIEIDKADVEKGRVSATTLFQGGTFEQQVERMLAVGVPQSAAIQAGQALENPFLQTEFRTQTVSASWTNTNGWEMQITAINYLDIRDSVQKIDGGLGG